MSAIPPFLLLKHFMPRLSGAERSAPFPRSAQSGLPLNDPHLQRAADDARNFLKRLSSGPSASSRHRS
jgi:hypothetical protein